MMYRCNSVVWRVGSAKNKTQISLVCQLTPAAVNSVHAKIQIACAEQGKSSLTEGGSPRNRRDTGGGRYEMESKG